MTIKVGIPVSLTGQFRLQGRQTLAGIQAWAADVNRSGGLCVGQHALPVAILWRDDASRAANARDITARLIDDDHADIIIGPYSAALTRAAAQAAQARRRLLWNQGGASPALYRQGNPWIVGILTPADQYLSGLLPAVREIRPEASTLAIIRAAAGEFPRAIAAGIQQSADALGFRVTLSRQLPPQPPAALDEPEIPQTLDCEFAQIISEICQSPPDVLVIAGRFQHDLRLAELLAQSAPRITAVAVIAAGVDAFRERLGENAENFIGPSQWEPAAHPQPAAIDYYGPSAAQVQESLRRAGYPAADYPAAQAYAAGVIIQRCAQESGSLQDAALRQAAATLNCTTFYGQFRIDPAGRPNAKPALLTQWRNHRKTIIWPPQYRQTTLTCTWR